MLETKNRKCGEDREEADRPASKTARIVGSAGYGSPETIFEALIYGVGPDVVSGAMDARDANSYCRSVQAAVEVCKNADLMSDMQRRLDAVREAERRKIEDEIRTLETRHERLNGDGRRPPKKG